MRELRFPARRLLKDPWSAAAAIPVTALGAGLNAASEGTAVWIPARAARALAFDNSVEEVTFRAP